MHSATAVWTAGLEKGILESPDSRVENYIGFSSRNPFKNINININRTFTACILQLVEQLTTGPTCVFRSLGLTPSAA